MTKDRPTVHAPDIIAAVELFADAGQVVELRALNVRRQYGRPATVSGYFDDPTKLAQAAIGLNRTPGGLYFTANPINQAMADHGARVLVIEREIQFKDRVRGEVMVSWGVAEAQELGIYELLRDTCGHELPYFLLSLGPELSPPRDMLTTTPRHTPNLAFYHPTMQEVMNPISDAVQTLAAVAVFADGPTRIRGVDHIRHKETDRIGDLVTELRKLGVEALETDDGVTIQPAPLNSASIETYDDHRMAMSLALVGLRQPGVEILNPSCTAKTYPLFFDDLRALAGND